MIWGRVFGTLLGFVAGRVIGAILGFVLGTWFDTRIGGGRKQSRSANQRSTSQKSEGRQQAEENFPTPTTLREAREILQISPSMTDKEIKKQYYQLMRQYHPDMLRSRVITPEQRAEFEQKAKNVRAAYDLIKKARKR